MLAEEGLMEDTDKNVCVQVKMELVMFKKRQDQRWNQSSALLRHEIFKKEKKNIKKFKFSISKFWRKFSNNSPFSNCLSLKTRQSFFYFGG